ncbi:hypothetical protein D3C87_1443390 [compost metagenome]
MVICPCNATFEPFGRSLAWAARIFWISAATPPRSRPWIEVRICTIGWMSDCVTTEWLRVRSTVANPPRICPLLPAAVVVDESGRLRSAASVSRLDCGVCSTIGYDTPLAVLSQNVGATWLEPARLTTRLLVTSRSLIPTSCARVRSTLMLKVGNCCDCWIRASTTPGTRRISRNRVSA